MKIFSESRTRSEFFNLPKIAIPLFFTSRPSFEQEMNCSEPCRLASNTISPCWARVVNWDGSTTTWIQFSLSTGRQIDVPCTRRQIVKVEYYAVAEQIDYLRKIKVTHVHILVTRDSLQVPALKNISDGPEISLFVFRMRCCTPQTHSVQPKFCKILAQFYN